MTNRIPTDVFEQVEELPARNYVKVLRNRVADLRRRAGVPAYYDQYPGKAVPRMYSKIYQNIPLTTPVRDGITGFEGEAALASLSNFLTPDGTNLLTGRTGAFYLHEVNTSVHYSWTYDADPGYTAPQSSLPAGGLFDPVIEQNGGGVLLPNQTRDSFTGQPNFCFELALYDKTRGAFLTDGKLPLQVFCGGTFGHKQFEEPLRFEADTEIEPRLFVTEFRPGNALNNNQPYDAANVVAHVNIFFKGVDVLEDFQTTELDHFDAMQTPGSD